MRNRGVLLPVLETGIPKSAPGEESSGLRLLTCHCALAWRKGLWANSLAAFRPTLRTQLHPTSPSSKFFFLIVFVHMWTYLLQFCCFTACLDLAYSVLKSYFMDICFTALYPWFIFGYIPHLLCDNINVDILHLSFLFNALFLYFSINIPTNFVPALT